MCNDLADFGRQDYFDAKKNEGSEAILLARVVPAACDVTDGYHHAHPSTASTAPLSRVGYSTGTHMQEPTHRVASASLVKRIGKRKGTKSTEIPSRMFFLFLVLEISLRYFLFITTCCDFFLCIIFFSIYFSIRKGQVMLYALSF